MTAMNKGEVMKLSVKLPFRMNDSLLVEFFLHVCVIRAVKEAAHYERDSEKITILCPTGDGAFSIFRATNGSFIFAVLFFHLLFVRKYSKRSCSYCRDSRQ